MSAQRLDWTGKDGMAIRRWEEDRRTDERVTEEEEEEEDGWGQMIGRWRGEKSQLDRSSGDVLVAQPIEQTATSTK